MTGSTRRSAVIAPLVGVLLVAGLAVAGTVGRPTAAPARTPQASALSLRQSALVCPNVTGSDTAPTTMTVVNAAGAVRGAPHGAVTVRTTPLAGAHAKTTTVGRQRVNQVRVTSLGHPVLVEASGPGAAGIVADQSRLIPRGPGRGLFSAPCVSPATDWWLTGADGRVGYADTLVLANPGTTGVNLTVTAWTTKGRVEPPRLQSFTLAPRTAFLAAVAADAPDAAQVALHVHANTGRVVAEVVDRRVSGVQAAGVDWIPPTLAPATDLVVPGFLGGPGTRRLELANPGSRDATVTLHVSTASGNFAPAGHQTVLVRAGRTTEVDLTSSFGAAPGAVVVHSDAPVTTSGFSSATGNGSRARPDTQWQPAAQPIDGPAILPDDTPPFDRNVRLYVTAPGAAAKVRVSTLGGDSRVLSVRSGRTLAWDPVAALGRAAYGPLVLTPVSGGPAYVSRTLYAYGAHGPLTTAEQPSPLPKALTVPAIVADPRVAVP